MVTLDNVVAEPGEGARVTLVAFAYEGFAFADGSAEAIAGSRVKPVHVINRTGRPKPPLAFAFRDRGAVLPGAEYSNVIRLVIANRSSDRTLRFVPPSQGPNPRRGSELSLSVDAELDGESLPTALCRVSEVEAIAVTAPDGWILRKEGMDSASPSWVFAPTRAIDLEPGEQLDVELRDVTSTNGPGSAPIQLAYRGLPGFWDGEQALSIDKSPIQIDHHGRIGIGDAAASTWPLSIRAAGDSDEWMSFADHDGKTAWHLNQDTGAGLNFVETHVARWAAVPEEWRARRRHRADRPGRGHRPSCGKREGDGGGCGNARRFSRPAKNRAPREQRPGHRLACHGGQRSRAQCKARRRKNPRGRL